MRPEKICSERFQQEVEHIRHLAETFRSERLRHELMDVARRCGELANLAHEIGL
jgi:hypothetical protein